MHMSVVWAVAHNHFNAQHAMLSCPYSLLACSAHGDIGVAEMALSLVSG